MWVDAEAFPLERCVREVAERVQTVAEQGNVRVRLDWGCNGGLIRGDQNRVRHIFANLITNEFSYDYPSTARPHACRSRWTESSMNLSESSRPLRDRRAHLAHTQIVIFSGLTIPQ
jgi:hypothetical protein